MRSGWKTRSCHLSLGMLQIFNPFPRNSGRPFMWYKQGDKQGHMWVSRTPFWWQWGEKTGEGLQWGETTPVAVIPESIATAGSTQYALGVSQTFCVYSLYRILTEILWDRHYYYHHFTDEKWNTQKSNSRDHSCGQYTTLPTDSNKKMEKNKLFQELFQN